MMTDESIKALFTQSIQTQISAVESLSEDMLATVELLVGHLLNGQRVFISGTDTSSSLAGHFVHLMTEGMKLERPPFPVISLTSSPKKQLAALGQSGDILLVIADKDSDQLTGVMESAISREMIIIALTSEGNELVSGLLGPNDVELRVPSLNAARVLKTQLFILHSLCEQIESTIFPEEH
tara:strand:- start:285 stop:827 length:543 start_codon:yes stop_codon:yes gene_type:complete